MPRVPKFRKKKDGQSTPERTEGMWKHARVVATRPAHQLVNYGQDVANRTAEEVQAKVFEVVEGYVNEGLDRASDKAKDALKDDYMPNCVKTGIDMVVDDIWPDVKEEVVETLLSVSRARIFPDQGTQPRLFSPWRVRAWLLHHYQPYDRSMWRQMWDPVFVLMSLMSAFPFYGVSQGFFLLYFLLLDKRDEFQLCHFILKFKSMQFLTVGLVPLCVGSVQFFLCIYRMREDKNNNCENVGPQAPYWEIFLFAAQVLVVWLATLLLPCSIKKGGHCYYARGKREKEFDVNEDGILDPDEAFAMRKAKRGVEEEHRGCCAAGRDVRGGHLRRMVMLDAFFAIGIFAVIIAAAFSGETEIKANGWAGNWRLRMTLYWCKALYGLLAFPFAFFKLPLLGLFLTHARPTGYNRNGITLPEEKHFDKIDPDAEKINVPPREDH